MTATETELLEIAEMLLDHLEKVLPYSELWQQHLLSKDPNWEYGVVDVNQEAGQILIETRERLKSIKATNEEDEPMPTYVLGIPIRYLENGPDLSRFDPDEVSSNS